VVGDTVAALDADLPDDWLATLTPTTADAGIQNWLRTCLVACWLAGDE
jgi:hypothetical protein